MSLNQRDGESAMSFHTRIWATVLTGSVALAGCSATPTQRSAGETIDDGVLTARVKTALIENDQTKARQIDVETYRGEVQLNGFVDSDTARAAATRVVRGVSGVTAVTNNLQVGADRSAGEVIDDAAVSAQVKTALIGDSRTKAHQIEVATHEGVVQLGGFVDSAASRTAASEVARGVKGVKRVSNELEVRQ